MKINSIGANWKSKKRRICLFAYNFNKFYSRSSERVGNTREYITFFFLDE